MSESSGTTNSLVSGTQTAETPAETTLTSPESSANLAPTPEKIEPAKTEPAAPVVEPLTAEAIKFPENFQVDEPVLNEFLGVMNNAELSPQARAQALVDLQAKVVSEASEKASETYHNLRAQWTEQAKTEFGERLEPTIGEIGKLIDAYGGTKEQIMEIRDAFALTGAGDNPSIFRLFANLAKELVKEGRPLGGQPAGGARTAAEILFPNQAKG